MNTPTPSRLPARLLLAISLVSVLFLSSSVGAENKALTKAGDTLAQAMPLAAIGFAATEPGWDAAGQFASAYVGTKLSTAGLKSAVQKERPDGSDRSFPSGHAANTFMAAGAIHARYGFGAAMVPYALAAITSYSRIPADKHYPVDVLAGAALGMAWSFGMVDPKTEVTVTPKPGGLQLTYKVDIK